MNLEECKKDNNNTYYLYIGNMIYPVIHDTSLSKTEIRMNAIQREEIALKKRFESTQIRLFRSQSELLKEIHQVKEVKQLKLSVTVNNKKSLLVPINREGLKKKLMRSWLHLVCRCGQHLAFWDDDTKITYVFKVEDNDDDSSDGSYYLVTPSTQLCLDTKDLSVLFQEQAPTSLFKAGWDPLNFGIGGLSREFELIFRRAFASRLLPATLVETLGIKHVRGVLLHGPPGCGKTLVARKICQAIHSVKPKIVNGPDLLSKYVGDSEANMRELFQEAEKEYKKKGENSQLHVIIFDEVDALCKQRGGGRGGSGNNSDGGTGVHDNLVNQLLTKFDGVEQLNNILIIGMTNRIDLLDEALLRPGRFEVQLEITLPDLQGRKEILTIHTEKLREAKKFSPEIQLDELAESTKNYTGAELEALVACARSCAIQRVINPILMKNTSKDPSKALTDSKNDLKNDSNDQVPLVDESKILVTVQDFDWALYEIKPKFGISDSLTKRRNNNTILPYCQEFNQMYAEMHRDLKRFIQNKVPQMVCFLIGSEGSGKTTLALDLALETGFPLIEVVNPEVTMGMTETEKMRLSPKDVCQDSPFGTVGYNFG